MSHKDKLYIWIFAAEYNNDSDALRPFAKRTKGLLKACHHYIVDKFRTMLVVSMLHDVYSRGTG